MFDCAQDNQTALERCTDEVEARWGARVRGAPVRCLVGLLGRSGLMLQAVFEIGVVDIVLAMKKRGFAWYGIIGITRRPLDRAMAQVDAVVAPEMPPVCFGRRWSNMIGFPAPVPAPVLANEEAARSILSEFGRCIGGHG